MNSQNGKIVKVSVTFPHQSFEELGESLTIRTLASIRSSPESSGFDYLYGNFISYCGKAELFLNNYETSTEHIFASLLETIALYLRFPANEEEFTDDLKLIENTLKEKIKYLIDPKAPLPGKNSEYLRLFYENDPINIEDAPQTLFEILLTETEPGRFLFANMDIPLCYMLYFIALDEYGHFSPIVKQAAIYALKGANEDLLWKKFVELRSDYFKINPVYAPIIHDVTVSELTHSICKALRLLEAEYEYETIFEISNAIFKTMPDFRNFLYNYPLSISNGDTVLSKQCYSLAFRSFHDIEEKSRTIKRHIEILDYSLPNSMGIPAVLFKNKELVIPLIRREYFKFKGVENEAELHLRSMIEPCYPPKEENLLQINEYIESIYGKPLPIDTAKEKVLELIALENENIAAMNSKLDGDIENHWHPIREGSYQWDKLYSILLKKFTLRNTLTLWELRGILYDMLEKPPKPFYYPVTSAIGKFFQSTISKILRSYEKIHPNFIKTRKRLYDYFYNKLDTAEKKLDVCGWKEYNGKCLLNDRNCCSIPLPSPCLTPTGCNGKALACKLWLCYAALSRLVSTKQGRRFLAKRRSYLYWCIAFNIPLKIRCSKQNSFDEKAKEQFVDLSIIDWYNKPLL